MSVSLKLQFSSIYLHSGNDFFELIQDQFAGERIKHKMTSPKRKHDEQDSKYDGNSSHMNKLLKLNENKELAAKALEVICNGISDEEVRLEGRVFDIHNRIGYVQDLLGEVRSAVVSNLYGRPECLVQDPVPVEGQTRIHPAVKKLLGIRGTQNRKQTTKALGTPDVPTASTSGEQTSQKCIKEPVGSISTEKPMTRSKKPPTSLEVSKLPRYLPPKLKNATCHTPRGISGTSTVLRRLIVGNVSRWLPADMREDKATHKWMMYIRIKDVPNSSQYITKVRYLLDPSYKPNDLVEVTSPPFYLTRRGWGEFPVRVQVHFVHPADKPLDVRHCLKLDTTYSGQDNLGSETLVDVYLHSDSETGDPNEDGASPAQLPSMYNMDSGLADSNARAGGAQTECNVSTPVAIENPASVKKECDTVELDNLLSLQPPMNKKIKIEVNDEQECESYKHDPRDLQLDSNQVKQEPPVPITNVSSCNDGSGLNMFYGDIDTFSDSFPIKEEIVETTDEICYIPRNEVTASVEPSVVSSPPPLTKPVVAKPDNVNITNNLVQPIQCKTSNDKTKTILVGRPSPFKPLQSKTSLVGQKVMLKTCETNVTAKSNPSPQETVVVKCLHQNGKTVFMTLAKDVAKALLSKGFKSLTKPHQNLATPVKQSPSNSTSLLKSMQTGPSVAGLNGKVLNVLVPEATRASTAITAAPRPKQTNLPVLVVKSLDKRVRLQSDMVESAVKVKSLNPLPKVSEGPSQLPQEIASVKASFLDVKEVGLGQAGRSVLAGLPTKLKVVQVKTVGVASTAPTVGTKLALKPGVSLLKVPPSPAAPSMRLVEVKPRWTSEEDRLLYCGRALVVKKAVGRPSNPVQCKDPNTFRWQSIVRKAIARPKFEDMGHAVRWFVRHFPIVHPSASESSFKSLYPYSAPSADVFLQWLQPKQRATEWLRAKTVQRALLQAGYAPTLVWSTKAISLWAREHGYVPLVPDVECQTPAELVERSSLSEHSGIAEWMLSNLASYRDGHHNDDISEVDVVNIQPPCVRVKVELGAEDDYFETMEMSHELQLQCCHIADSARQLGVRFEPEVIVPGTLYCAAERIMLEALKSFTEDLLRRSLAQAWERNLYRAPASITPSDVKAAILDRPEFDILTNSGIGVQPMDTG